jgi:type I restriction enzyme S subunit
MKQRYPTYKSSGVEWIGEIPEGWERKKLKRFALICNGSDFKEHQVDKGGYPVYGTGGEFARSSEFIYNKTSVLLGRKGTVNKPQIVFDPFWTSDTVYFTKIFENVCPQYLFFLVCQIPFDQFVYGSAIPSMTKSVYDEMIFPFPPLTEQQEIVTYLDQKTTLIDQIISGSEKKIELLKEQRTATINHAVTKGLNPKVKMKDSGVEWIGEIPEGWGIIKLKYCCSVSTGGKDTQNKIDDGVFPFYVRSPQVERINSYSYDGEAVLTAGDGVGTGKVFHYANGKFDFHQRVYKFSEFNHLTGRFFYEYIRSLFINVVEDQTAKSTVDSLRMPMIQGFLFTLPTLSEQQQIVTYLDQKTKEIDDLISSEQKRIELMKEYRQSLISEVVTGKIDVRTN